MDEAPKRSIHARLQEKKKEIAKINEFYLETGEYDEIFENSDDEYYPLYRYLIYLVRSD